MGGRAPEVRDVVPDEPADAPTAEEWQQAEAIAADAIDCMLAQTQDPMLAAYMMFHEAVAHLMDGGFDPKGLVLDLMDKMIDQSAQTRH